MTSKFFLCLHVVYQTILLFPIWKMVGMMICPLLMAPLNTYVNHLLSKEAENVMWCMFFKGVYDYTVWFVQNAFFFRLVSATHESLLLRLNMAKVKCGTVIPGVNQKQHKDLTKNSSKLQDFLFVIPMTWSSLVNFSVAIYVMDVQSDYPIRMLFTTFCVGMIGILTYIVDPTLYEKTKPTPKKVCTFDDAQFVRMKLSMGCTMDTDFERNKREKIEDQQKIQKYVILFINMIVTYISLIGKNIGQLHAFGNISWMIGCLADNLKSFQYYTYMDEFIILCKTLEIHTIEPSGKVVPIGKVDSVCFDKASFGYYSDDLTKNPERVEKVHTLSYTFKTGTFYYLEAPNGMGKSTTLKMLFSNLFSGDIFFGSTNRKNLSFADISSSISYLPQASEYTPSFTPEEIEPFSGRDKWLEERLGLSPFFGKDTVEMSGGQKKRMFLYITLTSPTPIVLLDETLAELDTEETPDVPEGGGWLTRVLNTLVEWKGRKNKIMLLVGHGLLKMIPEKKNVLKLCMQHHADRTVLTMRQ